MKIFLKLLIILGVLKPYTGIASLIKSKVPQAKDSVSSGGNGGSGGDRPMSCSGCIKC